MSGGLDDAVLDGTILSASLGSLDLSDDILKAHLRDKKDSGVTHHSVEDLAEDDVSSVEPWGLDGGEEELGAVGVLAGVRH